MQRNSVEDLKNFQRQHHFFIGIDSDGCAFDTMEIKHKECFIPNIIKYWNLQSVSKHAREAAEFVNLYSRSRGVNRFPGLIKVLDLLRNRAAVRRRKMDIPKVRSLQEWTRRENKLGNPALKTEIERTDDPVLTQALAWSLAVNASIDEMVHNLPPFSYVQKTLEKCQMLADLVVISSTPDERLIHEWTEQGLAGYVRLIVGQEIGSKKEHLSMAANGRYPSTHILVIGDAPGDLKAARANQALFYPIQPGCEEESWERFHKEAFLKFINKSYAGEYQTELIHAFLAVLPEKPSWDDRE